MYAYLYVCIFIYVCIYVCMYIDAVLTLAVLPNEALISGSRDSTIILWDPIDRSLDMTFTGHSGILDIYMCVSMYL